MKDEEAKKDEFLKIIEEGKEILVILDEAVKLAKALEKGDYKKFKKIWNDMPFTIDEY